MSAERPAAEKVHWNRITPVRLLVALAAFLVVFAPWLPKGWPVLILATSNIVVILYVLRRCDLAHRGERPFQLGRRSLLVLIAVVAVTCGWMTMSFRQAALQEKAVGPYDGPGKGGYPRPSAPDCLCAVFGDEFFRDISQEQNVQYLKDTEASDADLVFLNGLRDLRTLCLESPRFTDTAIEYIKDHKSLAELCIYNAGITDGGLERLAGLNNLLELTLINTRVSGIGLKSLNLSQLRRLALNGNRVPDDAWASIARLSQLQELSLSDAGISDTRMESIGNMRNLRHLELCGNLVTDTGFANASLEQIGKLNGLQYLDLGETKVTDAGLARLTELKGLDWINLNGTNTTAAGIARFEAASPNVKVFGP
jgi:hypothetical protein